MVQSNDVVNLWTFFDEWTRCASSRFQRDSLYRFAKFDGCGPQYKDLKASLSAKVMNDNEEAEAVISRTHYKRNLGSDLKNSPTAEYIWNLKETPGWDAE
jgi:hypothetical protein